MLGNGSVAAGRAAKKRKNQTKAEERRGEEKGREEKRRRFQGCLGFTYFKRYITLFEGQKHIQSLSPQRRAY